MKFVWKKVAQLVVVLLAVTFMSFIMISLLPGDLAVITCGLGCDQPALDAKREELHLNDNVLVRYSSWLGSVAKGDLGKSGRNQQPIGEALRQRLPVTLELVIYSQLLALLIAVPAAILAAQRAGGLFDRISTSVAFGFLSAPVYVLAPVLVLIFAVNLHWFPSAFYEEFTTSPLGNIKSFFLPALCLAVAELATYMRLLRTDLISTLQEDYITMAKSKGLSPRQVMMKHAFRPSTFSLITVIGLNFGRLLGGTLIIEYIFALNGLGQYIVEGIFGRDYLVVQAGVVVISVGYVLVNFAVDMLYAVLDPRIRHARALA